MALGSLLKKVEKVSKEVTANDMKSSGGSSFIKTGGVYNTTIQKAFMTETKKGGVCLNIHFGGDNLINLKLYIVSCVQSGKDKGNMITTCKMQGKTVSLPDFKMFKQLFYVATGEAKDLGEITTEVQTVKYKEYGQSKEEEAEVMVELEGKELNIAIRQEEEYAWDSDNKVTDRTALKVDDDGNPRYSLSLDGVYTIGGLSAMEAIKEKPAKDMEAKKEFLSGDKAIKTVKLELLDIPDEPEEEDELDF